MRSSPLPKIKLKRVGFVVKHNHEGAASLAIQLAEHILKAGVAVYFADESKKVVRGLKKRSVHVVPKSKLVDHSDFIIVLGGDGTYLSIARLMRTRSVPVMGINMGQLGFLTEIRQNEAFDAVDQLLSGKPFRMSERALMEVTLKRGNRVIFRGPVVNDAVVSKGAIARIIGMEILINNQVINTVRADGIIVSTPTGSSAYSLAAGGPILDPALGALIITPICPHSLTQRPLVVSDETIVGIRLHQRPGHVLLTLDGQDAIDMKENDLVTIRRFKKHSLKLISSPSRDYFSLLREKLKFGMR